MRFKISKKRQNRIISIALILFVLLVPILVIPFLRNTPNIGYITPPEAVFLELWNIDTFEGGKSSRSTFLENRAISFQKEHTNVYVVMRNLTLAQAEIQLANGIQPDFISFGTGAGDLFESYCVDLTQSFNVRSDLLAGGDGKAVPWCMGGYVLCTLGDVDISTPDDMLNIESEDGVLGFGYEYTVALNALSENISTSSQNIDAIYVNSLEYGYSQYSAYEDFLNKKFEVLLGTQRDFYRLKNRVNIGALSNCDFNYLGGYTDLLQWFAVTTTDASKQEMAELFIQYVLSEDIQKKLTSLGMFSVLDLSIYDNEYSDFEEVLSEDLEVGNAFWSMLDIQEKQANVLSKIFGSGI